MKIGIYINEITLANVVIGIYLVVIFFMGLYSKTIAGLGGAMFFTGVFFTLFVISLCVRTDYGSELAINTEFEIKNPILFIKRRITKFKVGDFVGLVGTDDPERKRGQIRFFEQEGKCNICVTWDDAYGTSGYYSKRELKLSRIENWKERIK